MSPDPYFPRALPSRDILAKAMSEHQLKDSVVQLAHQFGWLLFHALPAAISATAWVTPYQGDKGYVDLTMARAGHLLFVELKREGQRPSEEQVAWLSTIGGFLFQWDPKLSGPVCYASPNSHIGVAVWRPRDLRSGLVEAALQ